MHDSRRLSSQLWYRIVANVEILYYIMSFVVWDSCTSSENHYLIEKSAIVSHFRMMMRYSIYLYAQSIHPSTLSKNRIQDLVQRRRKAKPRLRKKWGQCSSCRSADSWVNLNKSYLSMYYNLFFLCEKHVHSEHVFIWSNIFSIFSHVPVFFHSFSMLIPTRRSIHPSIHPRTSLFKFAKR